MERHINTDKDYHANYLASLDLVYWMDANLIVLRQTAETLLNIPKEHLHAGTVSYGLYFLGIFHYHRNKLQLAEDNFTEVVKFYYADSPMNFAQSAFALALTNQALGKSDHARETCQAVHCAEYGKKTPEQYLSET